MTVKTWRFIALVALTISTTLTVSLAWIGLAYGSNLRKISEGASVCLTGERAYDSIAAAQMIGRLDLVSFLLTIGGILLAVFAFMGFWMIRREVLDEASRVAAEEARRVAQKYYAQPANAKTERDNFNPTHHMGGDSPVHSFDPSDVSVAGAVEETGATDDKSPRRSRRRSRAPKENPRSDG